MMLGLTGYLASKKLNKEVPTAATPSVGPDSPPVMAPANLPPVMAIAIPPPVASSPQLSWPQDSQVTQVVLSHF